MRDDGWRASIRWVVVHPDLPEVLARRDGRLGLPEAERAGQVWVGDPAAVLPLLRELLGGGAVLLGCLDEAEDPSARVQRVTMLAAARAPATPPAGTAWLGRADLTTIRRGTGEVDVAEAELRAGLRAAYLPAWSSFESPEGLARAWELAVPLGALHQAISYTGRWWPRSGRRSTST